MLMKIPSALKIKHPMQDSFSVSFYICGNWGDLKGFFFLICFCFLPTGLSVSAILETTY